MKVVLQRVLNARVEVDGKVVGEIGNGYLLLLGVEHQDTAEIAEKMAEKIIKLRIFADQQGKTNLSLAEVAGEILVISQFTLYADCRKGNRPSFIKAGSPEQARQLYETMITAFKKQVGKVAQGCFGADMKVSLTNDGPFTLVLDNRELGIGGT